MAWPALAMRYDGDLSLPLGLALGSPIFPSGCEGKLGVAHEHSLQGYTLPDHAPGITHPVFGVSPLPRPYTLGQMSTLPMLTQLPIRCTWGHMSTVSRVTLPPNPNTWGHTSTVFMVTSSQTLHLGYDIHSLYRGPFPDPTCGITCPQSIG